MNNYDSIIFDVDGTLWDVREVVSYAWRDIIKENTDWPITFDGQSLGAMFGKTMDTIFFHFYPNATQEEYVNITEKIYVRQNEYLMKYAPSMYPEAKETLLELKKKFRLFVVTNAQKGYVETLVKVHNLEGIFEDWLCFGDTNAPKDVTITKLMEKNGLKNSVYVGDTQGDADSCAKSGIPIIYAAYGLGKVEEPLYSIGSFAELKGLLTEPDTLVFDLDGTILDTLADLHAACNYAMVKHGRRERSKDEVRRFVGNGIAKLLHRAATLPLAEAVNDEDRLELPAPSDDEMQEIISDFRGYYSTHNNVYTKAFEGMKETLVELKKRGYKLGIVSNKYDAAVKQLSKEYFGDIFDVAVGETADVRRKPAPDMLNNCLKELGSDISHSVYIGDSEVDIYTAALSGMRLLSVTWGFRTKEELKEKLIIVNEAAINNTAYDGQPENTKAQFVHTTFVEEVKGLLSFY